MRDKRRRPPRSIESGDVPGNPLRSWRMSMLAHGFVDDQTTDEMILDDSDSVGYAVIRMHKGKLPAAVLVVLILTIAAIVAAVVVLG